VTRYRTIVADPPWPFQWGGGKGGRRRRETELGYPTLTVDEICDLPIRDLADSEGCHLYLWATDEITRNGEAVRVANAWGFRIVGPSLIWSKPNFGMGCFPRPSHEVILVCRLGHLPYALNDVKSVQEWNQPRGRMNGGKQHSRKPDGFLDLVERNSPEPRLELFARRQRLGWDTWGNEALEHIALEPSLASAGRNEEGAS
jgi:N6-adenosine-specific RNA methylase IME4